MQKLIIALGLVAMGCDPGPGATGEDSSTGVPLPDMTDTDTDGDTTGEGSGTDETGDDSDDESTEDSGPPSCNDETLQLSVEPPHVVLLLDKSGSMADNSWDHDDDAQTPPVTRWNSLHAVVDTLAHDVEDGIELGMVLFPSASLTETNSATACEVDAEPGAAVGLGNADSIVAAMPEAESTEIYGGTPVSAGLQVALDHLSAVSDGRPQAVVLVTDGAANCMDGTSGSSVFSEYDEDLAPLVAGAYADGIPTYVVGVDIRDEVGNYPVANPYERLSELAEAGGMPQAGGDDLFYNTTDEDQLLTALGGIAAELSCTIDLSTPAEFTSQLRVEIGGNEVTRVDECDADGEGWRYLQSAAPYDAIELCPASCDLAHFEATLDVEYSCLPPP